MKEEHSSRKFDVNNGETVKKKKKERNIVSWSQEEDDILREQIGLHGSENWAIIASRFKDKTTRQCRRRWFTYLNSDFKKGGWSPEEDILLCEAQRIYGNRWTEIAKVVSGRTDNAVKNRFTTLCKKRAKREATSSYINLNNKRVIFRNGLENAATLKKIRQNSAGARGAADHLFGHPYAETARNVQSYEVSDNSMENRFLPTFLNKDNPKVHALMQQSELLSSLAIKVNTDTTDQNLESAWMKKEWRVLEATKVEKLKEDLRSSDEIKGCRSSHKGVTRESPSPSIVSHSCREIESSPASSDYSSTGSTLCDKREECDAETGQFLQAEKLDQDQHCLSEASANKVKMMTRYEDIRSENGAECDAEFSSPTHVTPLFTTLAAAIPSPRFSESEKHFLMKTLGLEPTSPTPIRNPSQPPPCKKSLLHCL